MPLNNGGSAIADGTARIAKSTSRNPQTSAVLRHRRRTRGDTAADRAAELSLLASVPLITPFLDR
jgi:hypothetical protein